jgi:MFS transporter, MHS family, proline/betaine transporter
MLRITLASAVGNFLEFYDFIIFGVFASVLAKVFFPASDETEALLLTLATYGAAVFTRPLGAVVIGSYSDRAGRKAGLMLTLSVMAASTAAIGLTPGYASIGVAAPLLLVLARLAQGFSAGGEFGGATAFLSEHAPQRWRGFYAGWLQAGTFASAILAAALGLLVTGGGTDLAEGWGWRIPFLIGGLIAPIGLYIRRRLPESAHFERKRVTRDAASPLRSVVTQNSRSLLVMVGTVLPATTGSYIILIYLPTYVTRQLAMTQSDGFYGAMVGGVFAALLSPAAGALSDRLGRKRVMIAAMIFAIVAVYPLFAVLDAHRDLLVLSLVEAGLGALLALYAGPMTALGSELFSTGSRSTGLSLGYGISAALFGNFTPFLLAALIAATGSVLIPAFYLAAALMVGVVAVACARDRTGQSLASVGASTASTDLRLAETPA